MRSLYTRNPPCCFTIALIIPNPQINFNVFGNLVKWAVARAGLPPLRSGCLAPVCGVCGGLQSIRNKPPHGFGGESPFHVGARFGTSAPTARNPLGNEPSIRRAGGAVHGFCLKATAPRPKPSVRRRKAHAAKRRLGPTDIDAQNPGVPRRNARASPADGSPGGRPARALGGSVSGTWSGIRHPCGGPAGDGLAGRCSPAASAPCRSADLSPSAGLIPAAGSRSSRCASPGTAGGRPPETGNRNRYRSAGTAPRRRCR